MLLVKYKAQHLTMWLCLLSELLSEAMEIFNLNRPPQCFSTLMYKSTKSVVRILHFIKALVRSSTCFLDFLFRLRMYVLSYFQNVKKALNDYKPIWGKVWIF